MEYQNRMTSDPCQTQTLAESATLMRAARLGRLPAWLLPALVLLVLAVIAGLLWLPSAGSAQAQAGQTVAADWEHIPSGIAPGDSFRLLFVTSTTRDASSTDIADYNAHVQSAAGAQASVQSFKGQFTALISTASVDARDNTATTGTGVPIHWLGGEKVADDYGDFYDKDWDSVAGKTEAGGSYAGLVWTGGNKAGEKSGQRYAGAEEVRLGDLSDATLPLSSPTAKASSEAYPLYALSPVFTVAEPEPEPTPTPTPTPEPEPPAEPEFPTITAGPVIVSSPERGDTYGEGETIRVSVSFSEGVAVAGDVRVRLTVGERKRWARYDRSEADGAQLVFVYTVTKVDMDEDGVSIEADQLQLKGGSIEDGDGNAAVLSHPALTDQSGHRVDGSRETAPDDGQEPANSPPVFVADYGAALSVAEDAAVGANVGDPFTAFDDDGDVLTYALSGSDSFAVEEASGQTTLRAALDYETRDRYFVTVTASDRIEEVSISVTIEVVNVDEPGAVIMAAEPRAGEPLSAGVVDPDGDASGVAWTWARSVDQSAWEAIDGATGAVYTPSDDDVGKYLQATVAYTDPQGPGKTASGQTVNPVRDRTSSPQGQSTMVTCESPTTTGTRCWVPHDWPLIPKGADNETLHTPGQSFRLMFITSGSTNASSTTVGAYNTFVQNAANNNATLRPLKDHFRAMVSASDHSAVVNTKTSPSDLGASAPMYWVNGVKVADDYIDLYDGNWDYSSEDGQWPSVENGASITTSWTVWTGTRANGTAYPSANRMGGSLVVFGNANISGQELTTGGGSPNTFVKPLYGVSPVLTVADPPAPSTPPSDVSEVTCEAPTTTGTRCWVPHDWPLIPESANLDTGESFRLMFISTGGIAANSTIVAPYNTHVQGEAAGVNTLKPLKDHFRAMVQPWTAGDGMKANTRTRSSDLGTSNPIYWTNGAKVADDYADLYDGSWDYNSETGQWPSNAAGGDISSATSKVWTGSKPDGTPLASYQVGDENPIFGLPNTSGRELGAATVVTSGSNKNVEAKTNALSIYAISPVLTVGPTPGPTAPAVRSVTCEVPTGTGTRCWVPHDWPMIPKDSDGNNLRTTGQGFRLLFVTRELTDARSNAVGPYNEHVQMSVGKHNPYLRPFKEHFRALVQPWNSDHHMKPNTKTRSTDMGKNNPIYWVNAVPVGGYAKRYSHGSKVADSYADFYDGSWDSSGGSSNISHDDGPAGESAAGRRVWTGSTPDGRPYTSWQVGNTHTIFGITNQAGRELGVTTGASYTGDNPNAADSRSKMPLYGISPYLVVASEPGPDYSGYEEKTIWKARLTVDEVSGANGYFGCDNDDTALDNCSSDAVLTDEDFEFMGTKFWIKLLHWHPSNDQIRIASTVGSRDTQRILNSLTLHLDGQEFAFTDSTFASTHLFWRHASLNWTNGQKVKVKITAPTPPPAQVTGLKAFPLDEAVRLTWDELPLEPPVSHLEYQRRAYSPGSDDGGGAWGTWGAWTKMQYRGKDRSGSAVTHKVTGLTNGTMYQFRVRGVGPGGGGERAQTGAVTPQDKPDRTQNLIANSADGAAILHWDHPHNDAVTHHEYRWRETGEDVKWGKWQAVDARTVWSSTLTVDSHNPSDTVDIKGCDNTEDLRDCPKALSDPKFDYRGASYEIRGLTLITSEDPPEKSDDQSKQPSGTTYRKLLNLMFDVQIEKAAPQLQDLTLNVGSHSFPVRDGEADVVLVWKPQPSLTWSGGSKIAVSLTNEALQDSSDTTTHTLSGLTNDKDYEFQVRACISSSCGRASKPDSTIPEAPPAMPQAVSVPHDWEFIPGGVEPGESFRLLFATSRKTDAIDTRISRYNSRVAGAAYSNDAFTSFSDQFRAIISTAAVDARDNIDAAAGEGVPVYWVNDPLREQGSALVVSAPDDLFEDEWADAQVRGENGKIFSEEEKVTQVWTGSFKEGRSWKYSPYYFYAGAGHVQVGDPTAPGRKAIDDWSIRTPPANDTELPLYGISPVITVQEPPNN